jgi:DNA-binding MarR family transcriptional regulator
MANKYTDLVFCIRDLTTTQKIVLWCLAHRMNEKSECCWPGYGTIAKDACIGRSTAIRTVARLIELGWVEKIDSLKSSNSYRVIYETLLCRVNGWDSLPIDAHAQRNEAGENQPVHESGFQVEYF